MEGEAHWRRGAAIRKEFYGTGFRGGPAVPGAIGAEVLEWSADCSRMVGKQISAEASSARMRSRNQSWSEDGMETFPGTRVVQAQIKANNSNTTQTPSAVNC